MNPASSLDYPLAIRMFPLLVRCFGYQALKKKILCICFTVLILCLFFETRTHFVALCALEYILVDEAGLELTEVPASASQTGIKGVRQ